MTNSQTHAETNCNMSWTCQKIQLENGTNNDATKMTRKMMRNTWIPKLIYKWRSITFSCWFSLFSHSYSPFVLHLFWSKTLIIKRRDNRTWRISICWRASDGCRRGTSAHYSPGSELQPCSSGRPCPGILRERRLPKGSWLVSESLAISAATVWPGLPGLQFGPDKG